MSENQDQKKLILYIGGDQRVIDFFESCEEFKLVSIENGFVAVSWLTSNPLPFAIFSEVVMPGMNGYALHSEIMQKPVLQGVPFVLVDERFGEEEKKKALKLGVDDIFNKPLELEKIKIRLDFLVNYKKFQSVISLIEGKKEKFKIPLEKRLFDIVFASFAILLLSPLLIVIILAIKLESKGPVFYSGKRVGAGYNIFPFHKFRSMYTGADQKLKELQHLNQYEDEEEEEDLGEYVYDCPECKKLGKACSPLLYINDREICERQYLAQRKNKLGKTFFKIKNDPRVTKVGRFIRKTSIDELPQLFNVLKGEMSIVGNRPIPLYEAELLTSDDWTERFLAPAGITGLWQVSKRGKAEMSNEERKALDNEYARNYSFWGDIKIIFRTFTAVFQDEDV